MLLTPETDTAAVFSNVTPTLFPAGDNHYPGVDLVSFPQPFNLSFHGFPQPLFSFFVRSTVLYFSNVSFPLVSGQQPGDVGV